MNPVAEILRANNVLLAPMAGVTEAPFRGICKRLGAGLTYTEMVSAKGLHYNPDATIARRLLTFSPVETPAAVQLFGNDPGMMAAQAARIIERCGPDVALIDVNMGCPVTKVVAKGEGAALMRTPEIAAAVVEAIAAAVPVPVTAKFRSGWDADHINAVEFAQAMEAAGASSVAVHARTRRQFYHGRADWEVIAAVKRAVSIPVIGSGDVLAPADVVAMIDRTGADAVMVARGAQGDPWFFREARALLDRGEVIDRPTPLERIDVAREHLRLHVEASGERAFPRMRKHVAWYTAGLPGSTHVRARVMQTPTSEALDALLAAYRDYLSGAAPDPSVSAR